ncbi:DUF2510 domain-containing protein [Demequina salsinemoris]|uniref:DUF2510 domain-containing protein n=1 Tax=Demequina salsinemoris TaxID=577470 RepID=UPI0007856970|nr:DUF2510 domain-containing protein [Demequina salsinemoris]
MGQAAPAGWYADPSAPGTVRYWDGGAWTEHVAPAPTLAPAAVAVATGAPRTGMTTGARVLIVLGIIVAGFVVIGILAAISIPIFMNQQHKASDAEAQAAAAKLGVAIASGLVENPSGGLPQLSQAADGTVTLSYDGGWSETLELPTDVTLGGASGDAVGFCVFVLSSAGSGFQYDATSGASPGTCGQGEDLS